MSLPFERFLEPLVSGVRGKLDSLNISQRDKRTLVLGGVVLVVVLFLVIHQSISAQNRRLESRTVSIEKELSKLSALKVEYKDSSYKVAQIASSIDTANNDSLLSIVEKVLISANIDRGSFSIKSRSPQTTDFYDELSVGVDIKKIPLTKAIDVLYRFQNHRTFLKTSKFQLRTRFDNPDFTDLSFRISHFKFFEDI